ncbi:hypothetical protein [Thermomonospora amylolytica]|uniref:hypothetical protein n=1 Tax=Thermomonospora amylolytica TaxID=1411117 RepID=UPI0018E57027|nr:hypothetical protein [Thermomonospora amylolytica]
MLWPAGEPWPFCGSSEHEDLPGSQPIAMVPILQLYARDVPELPFPAATNLCQVLWCPFVHEYDYRPVVHVSWRDSSTVTDVLAHPPQPVASEEGLLPKPCTLSPERVTEYPAWELPEEVTEKIRAWQESRQRNPDGWEYDYHLAVAPGTKVGGWISWIQAPETVTCDQGHQMHHLLTIASWEHEPGSAQRWTPLQERHLLGPDFDPNRLSPTGLLIGDAGSIYLFTCLQCPDRPVAGVSQWS